MQTRTLAAATGVLVALGAALLSLRSAPVRETAGTRGGGTVEHAANTAISDWSDRTDRADPSDLPGAPPALAVLRASAVGRPAAPSPEAEAEAALPLFDPVRRTRALGDALRTWAQTDAGAALVWLDGHPEQETALLVQAVGEGAAHDPGAVTFALTYLAQDRELGALLAGALVRTLAEHGDAGAAVQLARAAPESWEHEWTTVAFTNLAYEDAATALEELARTEDPALRRTMAGAIIAGWAERDPAELAQHADVFNETATRTAALHVALTKWQQRDPAGASAFAAALAPRS